MKKPFLAFLYLSVSFAAPFVSCIRDGKHLTERIDDNEIKLTSPAQTVRTINFTATAPWSLTLSDADDTAYWLDVNPKNGEAGDVSLILIIETNDTFKERKGEFMIDRGSVETHVTVIQPKQTYLFCNTDSDDAVAGGIIAAEDGSFMVIETEPERGGTLVVAGSEECEDEEHYFYLQLNGSGRPEYACCAGIFIDYADHGTSTATGMWNQSNWYKAGTAISTLMQGAAALDVDLTPEFMAFMYGLMMEIPAPDGGDEGVLFYPPDPIMHQWEQMPYAAGVQYFYDKIDEDTHMNASIGVSPDQVEAPAAGVETTLTVTLGNYALLEYGPMEIYNSNTGWMRTAVASSANGTAEYTLTVDENTTAATRTGTVIFRIQCLDTGLWYECQTSVEQRAGEAHLSASPTELLFEAQYGGGGERQIVNVSCNTDWEVDPDGLPDWCHYEQFGDRVEVWLDDNGNPETRICILGIHTVAPEGTSVERNIEISQQGFVVDNPARELLIRFYQDTGGDNWINNEGWCSDRPLNEWWGVIVNPQGELLRLYLPNNNLTGYADLHGCTSLIELDCSNNYLTALDITGCYALWRLNCQNNMIDQEIPEELYPVFDNPVNQFFYDRKYIYADEEEPDDDEETPPYIINMFGWWYHGEPEQGYHRPY